MWRRIIAVFAGLVVWATVATALNWGLRLGISGYHAAESVLHFTLTMQIARLALAVICSLAAGAVIARIAPARGWPVWTAGGITLLLFLPSHYMLLDKFPWWYHAFFLLTILPLYWLGARMAYPRTISRKTQAFMPHKV